jgi:hypothetical protein
MDGKNLIGVENKKAMIKDVEGPQGTYKLNVTSK